jgi:hypothetical protein
MFSTVELLWATAVVLVAGLAGVIVYLHHGGGTAGQSAAADSATVTKLARRPAQVVGSLIVTLSTQRRFGDALRPTVSDPGLLINRGRRPVYISGRPLVLELRPLLPRRRLGSSTYYALAVPGPFHFAGLAASGSRAVFVVATTKRPPTSPRDVPGRRIAVWYTLDGGSTWATDVRTITTASRGSSTVAIMPDVRRTDEKTAVVSLLARGLVPEIRIASCAQCGPAGRVVRQAVRAGRQLERWSRVRIDVSGQAR